MSVLDNLRDQIANHLLTHVGGDESQPWQAGHNYAMTEAARLVRERWDQLGQSDEAVRDMVADVVAEAIQQATSTKARSYMSEEDIAHAVSGAVEELLGQEPRHRPAPVVAPSDEWPEPPDDPRTEDQMLSDAIRTLPPVSAPNVHRVDPGVTAVAVALVQAGLSEVDAAERALELMCRPSDEGGEGR